MATDKYVDHLKSNEKVAKDYYLKSFQKTEQQKFLETLLPPDERSGLMIGDFAAGAGTLSYHLNNHFNNAQFVLFDLNESALQLAKDNIQAENFQFLVQDLYNVEGRWAEKFDYVFCWQTLLVLDQPELGLKNLIKSCKKGGSLYLSALFNLDRDVDVYSKFVDHTRKGSSIENAFSYNTYCMKTIESWLQGSVKSFDIFPFKPTVDFSYDGRGIGTHTLQTISGERLQISGGMLMNWGILKIVK